MKVDIEKIDQQLAWLVKEEARLRNLRAYWAENNAIMLHNIHETLRQLRQEQQMTGMDGRPIS